jgi:hypothetical protein
VSLTLLHLHPGETPLAAHLRDLILSLPRDEEQEEEEAALHTAGTAEDVEVQRGGRESENPCAQERASFSSSSSSASSSSAGELVTLNDSPARPVSRPRSAEGSLPAIAEHYQEAGGGIDEGYTDEDFEVEC